MKAALKIGQVLTSGPYKNAVVVNISKNGWVQLQWPTNPETFAARAHWIQETK